MVPRRKTSIFERSTGELMVLMIAGTVCVTTLFGVVALVIIAFIHPQYDAASAARAVSGMLNALIGLLAGFLAGRTDVLDRYMSGRKKESPDGTS
jgi:cytochrome c biogenesis protein CcdA